MKDVEKAGGNVMGSAIGTLVDHVKWILISGEQAQRRGGDWAHNSERGAYSISNAEDLDSGCSSGVEEMVNSLDAALERMEPDESRDQVRNVAAAECCCFLVADTTLALRSSGTPSWIRPTTSS